jgi:hypothetical protein
VKSPDPADAPVLITEAARSYEEEFATRRRRYSIMMSMRVPCLVLAAVFYHTPWLAATLIIASIPLPWMAVLIANDRLPLKASKFKRYRDDTGAQQLASGAKQLEAKDHPVIES